VSTPLQLPVTLTQHTAEAVRTLRAARRHVPCPGSLCAAVDASDPCGALAAEVYAECIDALDVGARVFGFARATEVGAHCDDSALVIDVAVYHLTGAMGDVPAALNAFRRAAGPLLERTRP
jgi:hypothetical protein